MKNQALKYPELIDDYKQNAKTSFRLGILAGIGSTIAVFAVGVLISMFIYV